MLAAALTGGLFRLYMYDRPCLLVYNRFDMHKKPARFVRILCFLCTASDTALGFDPTVETLPRGSDGKDSTDRVILSDTLRFDIQDTMYKSKVIRGRATTVYRGEYFHTSPHGKEIRKRGVLKDAWPDIGGPHEVDIVKRLQHEPSPYIVVPAEADYIGINRDDGTLNNDGGSLHSTFFWRSLPEREESTRACPDKQVETLFAAGRPIESADFRTRSASASRSSKQRQAQDPAKMTRAENRRHVRLLYHREGIQREEYKELRVLVLALRDVLLGLKHLYEKHQVLHRDISLGNILINEDRSGGFLIDFDLAYRLDQQGLRTRRSGTPDFMSCRVMSRDNHKHTLDDDIESVFYVLLNIVVLQRGVAEGAKSKSSVGMPSFDFAAWRAESLAAGGSFIKIAMLEKFDMEEQHIPHYFQPICILLRQFHHELFPAFISPKGQKLRYQDDDLSIDNMIAIFDDFLPHLPHFERLHTEKKMDEFHESHFGQCVHAEDIAQALQLLPIPIPEAGHEQASARPRPFPAQVQNPVHVELQRPQGDPAPGSSTSTNTSRSGSGSGSNTRAKVGTLPSASRSALLGPLRRSLLCSLTK